MSSWIDIEANRKALQTELQRRGFYKGAIDGKLYEQSADAIIAFRKSIGRTPATSNFNTQLLIDLGLTEDTTPKGNPVMGSILLSFLNSSVALGILRNILMALGAVLVTRGFVDQNTLAEIVGGVLSAVSAVLSAISNNNKATDKAIVKAVEQHPAITVIAAVDSPTSKPIIQVSPTAGGNMRAAS